MPIDPKSLVVVDQSGALPPWKVVAARCSSAFSTDTGTYGVAS